MERSATEYVTLVGADDFAAIAKGHPVRRRSAIRAWRS